MINKKLAKERGLSKEQIALVEDLQEKRVHIEKNMSALSPKNDRELLIDLLKAWRANEFSLQDAWGFKKDADMHRDFWIPHCSCPKMDNEDVLGTGIRYINPQCIYHGKGNKDS